MFDILVGNYVENVRKLQKEGAKFQLVLVNQKKNIGFLQTLYEEMEKVLEDNATVFLYSNSEMLDVLIEHATEEGGEVLTVFDDNNEVAKACFRTKRNITTLVKGWNERKEKENELIDYLEGGEKNPHQNKEEEKKNCLFI